MGKTSEFTDVVLEIIKEGETVRKMASKTKPVPLMQERLSKREVVSRLEHMTPQDLSSMTPEDRAALIKEVGTDSVLGIIRRQR